MFLYNESGKKFEIDDSRENMINHGCCGEIYKYKNDCVKLYYGLSLSDGKISKKVFETLKEIDPDLFYFSNNVEYCKISNYNRLLQLFRSIYLEEVKKILDLDYSKNSFTDLGELFNLEMGPNMDNELSKKLKKYRCPRDYFKSKK